MAKAKMVVCVIFYPCGAEFHPSFSRAKLSVNGQYHLEYPINNKDFLKSRKAQVGWAEEKIKHLKSWGSKAQPSMVEYPITE